MNFGKTIKTNKKENKPPKSFNTNKLALDF